MAEKCLSPLLCCHTTALSDATTSAELPALPLSMELPSTPTTAGSSRGPGTALLSSSQSEFRLEDFITDDLIERDDELTMDSMSDTGSLDSPFSTTSSCSSWPSPDTSPEEDDQYSKFRWSSSIGIMAPPSTLEESCEMNLCVNLSDAEIKSASSLLPETSSISSKSAVSSESSATPSSLPPSRSASPQIPSVHPTTCLSRTEQSGAALESLPALKRGAILRDLLPINPSDTAAIVANDTQVRNHLVSFLLKRGAKHIPEKLDLDAVSDIPGISTAELLTFAIYGSPEKRLMLAEIYPILSERRPTRFPPNVPNCKGWKDNVRHVLSLHSRFVVTKPSRNNPFKGGYWTVVAAGIGASTRSKAHHFRRSRSARSESDSDSEGSSRGSEAETGYPNLDHLPKIAPAVRRSDSGCDRPRRRTTRAKRQSPY
ncbi:Fork-head domain-containing protein [Mycena chlorophos]|uniref:Fork-head domain-containing protein n=1 Tax=Mycena chlorophos TaxID=658473 RepID=A0A8H6WHL9_MYCCL|nr:Fork-head domain-containing protein [Mycena chlorophos]